MMVTSYSPMVGIEAYQHLGISGKATHFIKKNDNKKAPENQRKRCRDMGTFADYDLLAMAFTINGIASST